jgi:predicted aspartyl protease
VRFVAYAALLLLAAAVGCRHLVTSGQSEISEAEKKRLLAKTFSPEELGVRLVTRNGQSSARWTELVSAPGAVRIPLARPDSQGSFQPLVPAKLNGRPAGAMVLDTGAPVTLVHGKLALQTGVRILNPDRLGNTFRGIGGEEKTFFGVCESLAVGPLEFQNVLAAIRTEEYRHKLLNVVSLSGWQGNLIGLSSLSRLAYVTIDYPAGHVIFEPDAEFPPPMRNIAQAPFKLEDLEIHLPITINGQHVFQALVDTGSDATLMINTNMVRALGLEMMIEHGKPGRFVGLGGDFTSRTFQLGEIKLGQTTFRLVDAATAPDDYPLTIGSGFFHRFKTTLDFKRKLLWLEKSAATP